MSGKKGLLGSEMMMTLTRIAFLIVVLFSTVFLVKTFIITKLDTRGIESSVLVSRLLYSPGVISYADDAVGREYPGVIDRDAFQHLASTTPNDLDLQSMTYGDANPILAARITLKQEGRPNIDVYYQKERFNRWEPRTLSTVTGGAGSVRSFDYLQYVLVKDGEQYSPGTLLFRVLA